MNIKMDSLISFDTLNTDLENVFSIVEKNGKVILLKNNKPTYIILKYSEDKTPVSETNYTLHEAMKIVLSETPNNEMKASELADEIYNRKLYLKKNGTKAEYIQIRARCGNYPDLFEALPNNYIKLKV